MLHHVHTIHSPAGAEQGLPLRPHLSDSHHLTPNTAFLSSQQAPKYTLLLHTSELYYIIPHSPS